MPRQVSLPSTPTSLSLQKSLPSSEKSVPQMAPSDNRSERASKRSKRTPSVAKRTVPRAKRLVGSETLLTADDTLRERWFIKGLIGQGGYGEIYLALDMKQPGFVALKTENRVRRGRTSKRMILEQRVLLQMQGKPHVPKMIASGHDERMNFIAMELLSVNIGDLKKQSPMRRLGRSTVGRIMVQAIAALRDVHCAGYIHRDVKPANICFGVTPATRHILYLVDFGLVRKFRLPNGATRPFRRKTGFRGTLRYVSSRVHDRQDQSPVDDLVSLAYSGIELLIGDLPWKSFTKHDEVKACKEELKQQMGEPGSYLAPAAESFQVFIREILLLEPQDDLNYPGLQGLLAETIGDKRMSDPYDWENNYKEAMEPSTRSDASEGEK